MRLSDPRPCGRRRGRAGDTPRSFFRLDTERERRPSRTPERLRLALAVCGVHCLASAGDDEIQFPLLFVAPEMNPGHAGRDKRIQHQVLPKHAAILRPQTVPPAGVADQPGVKAEDLELGDNLPPSARRKGPHQMNHVGYLIDFQPIRDGRPADAALGGQSGNVQQPAALPQQQSRFTLGRLNVKQPFALGWAAAHLDPAAGAVAFSRLCVTGNLGGTVCG